MNSIIHTEARAKINWCLNITGKRPDGYHLLDMLMQRVSLSDTLFFAPDDRLTLSVFPDDTAISGDNLVLKAAEQLLRISPGHGARITLNKRIPMGAGMGGGSSDAAATLKALNHMWGLGLQKEQLAEIALSLGADVPFFIYDAPMRVRGVGENLTPVSLPAGICLLLIQAVPGLNTGKVFQLADRYNDVCCDTDIVLKALLDGDFLMLERTAVNMLARPAFELSNGLNEVYRAILSTGPLLVRMTGSGSVLFGVYPDQKAAANAAARLRMQYPHAFICRTETVS